MILALALLQMVAFSAPLTNTEPVKPLKCEKYQHVYHWPGNCGPEECDGNSCYAVCTSIPPDRCVDDMHEITERDWQNLLQRLNKLEHAR